MAVWLPLGQVSSPTLREKLLGADLSTAPEPVNASVIVHDNRGRYLVHLRDQLEGIWEPGVFALLGGGRAPATPPWRRPCCANSPKRYRAWSSPVWRRTPWRRPQAWTG